MGSVPNCIIFHFDLLNSLFFFAKEPIIELSLFVSMRRFTVTSLIFIMTVSLLNAKEGDGQDVIGTANLTHELMRFAGNIHQFNSIFPQEKVYIQFDNTSYYTGETIWFKAFVVNASTLQKAQSKVLYVDLISPTGELLKQQKLKIVAGQADGSFPLLDGSTEQAREKRGVLEYPSGFYEIRAYTNYMLNFGEETVFSRVFAVYEKPKKEGNYYAENPTIKIQWSDVSEIRPKTENLRRINCEFYPEGGHLVIGVPNRVAFKVTDETGFGVDASGILDDTDITFRTVHDGMGCFTFTPTGHKSTVTITVDGKSRTFALPRFEESGLILRADAYGNEDYLLRVDCTPDLIDKTLGIAVTCRGELVDFHTIVTTSHSVEQLLIMSGIPEGVCQVYLFGADGNIYASRSIYHHSGRLTSPSIEVIADKENYEPFDKVALNFNLKDGLGNPFRDRFCLSVRDVRGQGNALADDLRTSMLLSSDLKGFIEHPSWYFDSDDPDRNIALDLLMLVQGWERYDWQTMTGQKEFDGKHRVEENLTVNGWIMNSSGKKPMDSIVVNAALIPNDKTLTEVYSYKTDSSGYFGFDLGPDFYDKAQFQISAQPKRKRLIGPDARIVFDRSLFPAIRAYKPQELVFTELQSTIKNNGRKDVDVEYEDIITVLKKENVFVLPEVDIEEQRMYVDYFTFKAYDVVKDVEIEMDHGDYSTDLLGYLLEKGYSVSIEWDDELLETIIKFINGYDPFFYIHNGNMYLDHGVYENPIALESMDVKSIIIFDRPMWMSDVIMQCPLYSSSYQFQSLMEELLQSDGVTAISDFMSKRKLLVDILIKEPGELSTRDDIFNINKRTTTVDGYSRPYAFYSPEYPDGPIPGDADYRRTLYWNPNVITDEDGHARVEFYNNSFTRKFTINAAGITASGIPYILNEIW